MEILKDFLEFKIKTLGKSRTHHPTDEAINETIKEFNKKYGTNFELLSKE